MAIESRDRAGEEPFLILLNVFCKSNEMFGVDMRFYVITLLVVLLSACSAPNRIPVLKPSQDGRPAQTVDVSTIPDARPAPVVRTRAGNAPKYTVLGKTYRVLPSSHGYKERGEASWYGTKFHGRRTANGEVYNMFAMTAAHKTLPIPSYVRVTHVGNGRSIVVRINDRGPFHGNRIIDLSYAAAKKLGVIATGVAQVDVVDVTPTNGGRNTASVPVPASVTDNRNIPSVPAVTSSVASASSSGDVYLQLGAFQQPKSAETLRDKIAGVVSHAVNVIIGRDKLHRVFVGPFNSRQQVVGIQSLLRQRGLSQGHIVQNDIRNN